MMIYEKLLVFSDLHIPNQNLQYQRILLDIIKDFKPNILVDCGDGINANCLSTYPKRHSELIGLQKELEEDYMWREAINKVTPNCERWLIKSNHFEKRLSARKKDVLWLEDLEVLKAENLLKLKELKWETTKELLVNDSILFIHSGGVRGNIQNPVNKVRQLVKETGITVVRAHTHNSGFEVHKQYNKQTYAIQIGTFQDPNKTNYIENPSMCNFTTSIGTFYLFAEDKHFIFTPIIFDGGKAVCEGRVYK